MFDISAGELIIVGVVALIVIGPKELPGMLRSVGQAVAKVRRMAGEFQSQFSEAMREAEFAEAKKKVEDIGNSVSSTFTDTSSTTGSSTTPSSTAASGEADKPLALPEPPTPAPVTPEGIVAQVAADAAAPTAPSVVAPVETAAAPAETTPAEALVAETQPRAPKAAAQGSEA